MILPKRWEVVGGLCLLNGYKNGAELGVSTGRFSTFILAIVQGSTMVAVDLWAPQPGLVGEGSETYADWPHEENYKAFTEHNAKYHPGRLTVHRMKTVDAAPLVDDGSLDFVFIDADHTYEGALADIKAWTPKVRAGGMVSGHDYNWPSVKRAVNETGEDPHVSHDNVWFRYAK